MSIAGALFAVVVGIAHAGEIGSVRWPPDPALYAVDGTPVAPGLAVGDVLDESNATTAAALLPPEILRHYANGEYRNAIASLPDGIVHYGTGFERATATNAGRYDVDPGTGTIVEAATGAPATDIYGLPFPSIAPDDPAGGVKAVWNQFHAYWHSGNQHVESEIVWVRASGLERQAVIETHTQFYENQEPRDRVPNPEQYVMQTIAHVKSPADLQGTIALSYRYRDPARPDTLWAYVPALRRVRSVSPTNRSDGLLGTDISLDDNHFFDAKVEAFTWRTIGLRDGLRLADPMLIRGEGEPPYWTGSGWRPRAASFVAAGFQVPGWRGVGWAPASAVLVKRRFWVVEAVPRDPDYLFGRIELWIDAESWTGAWSRKFSWKGGIAATYQIVAGMSFPVIRPGGSEVEWVTAMARTWLCMEAIPFRRATIAGFHQDDTLPIEIGVTHPVHMLFDLQALARLGR